MRQSIYPALLSLLFAITMQQPALAVQLPSIFSNGMVIQRDQKLSIWGKAAPHEQIKVLIDDQTRSTVADLNGDWLTVLNPVAAGKERTLIVQGANKLVISNIKIGDVYLCSGQSNMAFPLGSSDYTDDDISHLDKLQLKIYTTPKQKSTTDVADAHGAWHTLTREAVTSFPAIPYLFGRSLSLSRKVPIGIICAPCCGATLESFLPPETVKRMHCENVSFIPRGTPSSNFRTLLYPFLNVSLSGIVWYQGEANFLNTAQYRNEFPAFICDLRKRMNAPNLPFLFVQLPSFGYRQEEVLDSFWADMREAQAAALALPNVRMVVSIDTSTDAPPLHPKEKREIARRLAIIAQTENEGHGNLLDRAPRIKSAAAVNDAMVVSFSNLDKPLSTSDGRPPHGFQLAGADRKFHWAEAELSGDTIKITSDDVLVPQAVRYAYSDNPDSNLCCDGMPVAPFRTDTWPTYPKLNPAAREIASH